ncbi:hypothetical protein P5673_021810 [Acropora cervicornis]|uniref:HECT domain-containing protein n=1 Tax=Acropora cervicornis TaxID=6130 RepID=A0AAD9UZY9_ACRCE|nr:hypothetical protein P5673_021810 [Acropora cervicornis]
MREKYFLIGIVFGLSIIQNGKIPTFLPEEIIQSIFSAGELEPCLAELQNGFQKVGIYQLACQLPMFLCLLRPSQAEMLTVKKVTHLLKPEFSGRRAGLSLGSVLQFTTGADNEPALGFTIHPSLTFVEATTSFFPSANTCISRITLPHPSMDCSLPPKEKLFNLYDLAFCNAYFGHV